MRALTPLGRGLASQYRARAAGQVCRTAQRLHSTSQAPTPLPSKDAFRRALDNNQRWASSIASSDKSFFENLSKGQAPPILWLGCCDSRVPETILLGLQPGDVFTHRSVANIITPTDLNMLSAVEFATRYIKVQHIVVCGHTSCGGVNGALSNSSLPIVELWLQPLRALREKHAAELEKLSEADRVTHLAKLNVQQGVAQLRRMPTVIEAIDQRGLQVHGVILNLATGVLEEVDCQEDDETEKTRRATFELK